MNLKERIATSPTTVEGDVGHSYRTYNEGVESCSNPIYHDSGIPVITGNPYNDSGWDSISEVNNAIQSCVINQAANAALMMNALNGGL